MDCHGSPYNAISRRPPRGFPLMDTWIPEIRPGRGDTYVFLADAIEHAIRAGRLKTGERLPTHRDLSRRIGIAVSTVTRAYAEAAARGLIESTVGRGTFVKARNDAGGRCRRRDPAA